jgi:chromosome segregation and condensation protein ScpB
MSVANDSLHVGDARKKPHHLEVTEAFLSKFRKDSAEREASLEK